MGRHIKIRMLSNRTEDAYHDIAKCQIAIIMLFRVALLHAKMFIIFFYKNFKVFTLLSVLVNYDEFNMELRSKF